jgi:hypothetical protein
MQEILVDRDQLALEHLVQKLDDLDITFHGLSSVGVMRGRCKLRARTAEMRMALDGPHLRQLSEASRGVSLPGGSGYGKRELANHLRDGSVEGGARFRLTAAATVGTTLTCLQLGKRMHPVGRFAADVMIGNGVAQADIWRA